MTATFAASTAIVKTLYSDGVEFEGMEEPTFLDTVKSRTDFKGDKYVLAMQTDGVQGSSTDFNEAQAGMRASPLYRFEVTRVEHFTLARIKDHVARAISGNGAMLKDYWKREIEAAAYTERLHHKIMAHRDGTGARGQLATATSGVGTATITLQAPDDVENFAEGMGVIGTASSTTGAVLGGPNVVVISGLDRAAGTLTTAGGNWNAQIPGLIDGSYLFRRGEAYGLASASVVMTGFNAWIGNSNTLFGCTRTNDNVKLAGQSYDATGVPMEEAFIEAAGRLAARGTRPPDTAYIHPRDAANLIKSLEGKVVIDKGGKVESSSGKVGFRSVKIIGLRSDIDVVPDVFCQRGTMKMTRKGSWCHHSLGPVAGILQMDGNEYLRVANDMAYEVRVGTYNQLWTSNPRDSILVSNFGSGV